MYGADQNITFFDQNINLFNLNKLDTPLNRIKNIDGITTPYVYIGRKFSTFAWHTEDYALFSGMLKK